jgi:succinate dehydrogenase / fumarate reductase flavoprotein subunit/L-aspartate oxidase
MNGERLPKNIKDFMKIVESTREERLESTPPIHNEDEKQEIIKKFHPDFIPGNFTQLKWGPNKGERVAKGIADILEGQSYLKSFKKIKPDFKTEVLVIGGGGAGITTAIFAHDAGAEVTLVTKLRLGDSNTIMAQGGIQVAIGQDDSPVKHFEDSLKAGGYKNDKNLLKIMVEEGPEILAWLEELGVNFSKDKRGEFILKKGGGASKKRLVYAKDYTGLELMRVLIDEFRERNIKVLEFSPVVELLSDKEGGCAGAVFLDYDNMKFFSIQAKVTVIATGGSGRLHLSGFPTSNHYGATGDGLVIAYRLGAKIRDLDSFQFHPTGIVYPPQMFGLLVTEAIRSEGGQLVNANGERFVNEIDKRDFVSSAIIRECFEGRGVVIDDKCGVWLDIPIIEKIKGPGYIKNRFPAMYRQFKRFGWDIRKFPVIVYPTLHYQNGGIVIDSNGKTSVENLFAVGEVTGGIHGRNRLMGNSLLEVFVFARRVGNFVAELSKNIDYREPTLTHLEKIPVSGKTESPILLPHYFS